LLPAYDCVCPQCVFALAALWFALHKWFVRHTVCIVVHPP
jgi:hypothetical protein